MYEATNFDDHVWRGALHNPRLHPINPTQPIGAVTFDLRPLSARDSPIRHKLRARESRGRSQCRRRQSPYTLAFLKASDSDEPATHIGEYWNRRDGNARRADE